MDSNLKSLNVAWKSAYPSWLNKELSFSLSVSISFNLFSFTHFKVPSSNLSQRWPSFQVFFFFFPAWTLALAWLLLSISNNNRNWPSLSIYYFLGIIILFYPNVILFNPKTLWGTIYFFFKWGNWNLEKLNHL